MKTTSKKSIDAETIANMADRGEEVSQYFSKPVRKAPLIESQRVNVDFPIPMLNRLDEFVAELGTGRQAVIKMAVMTLIDQHNLSKKQVAK